MEVVFGLLKMIAAIGGAILINKTTEAGGFEWIRKNLRLTWTLYLFTVIILLTSEPYIWESFMRLNRHLFSESIIMQYILIFVLGGLISCLLFGIAGKITTPQKAVSQKYLLKSLPGISVNALIRINDSIIRQRKYIFDLGNTEGERFSIYLSPTNIFTLNLTDNKGEPHILQVPSYVPNGIPIGKFFFLTCQVGIAGQSTAMHILVNGNEISGREFPFSLDINKFDPHGGVIGADIHHNKMASFDVADMLFLHATMESEQIKALVLFRKEQPISKYIVYDGTKWMHIAKSGPMDLTQEDNRFQPIWIDSGTPITY